MIFKNCMFLTIINFTQHQSTEENSQKTSKVTNIIFSWILRTLQLKSFVSTPNQIVRNSKSLIRESRGSLIIKQRRLISKYKQSKISSYAKQSLLSP